MCTAITDGGRRCPAHQHRSVAIRRVVSHLTGLNEGQLVNLFRELRREGSHAESVATTRVDMSLEMVASLSEDESVSNFFNNELTAASRESETPNNATAYALTRLYQRARDRAANLNGVIDEIATNTGYTTSEVREHFDAVYAAQANATHDQQPEYNTTVRQRYVRAGLPYERETIVALERTRNQLSEERETRPRIGASDLVSVNSTQIEFMGRDQDGRVEVYFHGAAHPYAYQNVPQEVFDAIVNSGRPGRSYNARLRGNPEYTYASAEAAEMDSQAYRCVSCGQFRARVHSCPERAARANIVAEESTETTAVATPTRTRRSRNTATTETAAARRRRVQSRVEAGDNPTTPAAAPVAAMSTFSGPSATVEELNAIVQESEFQERLPFATIDSYTTADGQERNRINLGDTLVRRNVFTGNPANRSADTVTHTFADRANPTPDELNAVNELHSLYSNMRSVQTLHFVNQVRTAVRQGDVRMPVGVTFGATYMHGTRYAEGQVTGALTLGHLAEGETLERVVTQESQLRCTCDVYRRNYSCVHTRAVANMPYPFLVNRSRTFAENGSINQYVDAHSAALRAEEEYRTEMERSGVTRDQAAASISERVERERVAAEQAAARARTAAERRNQEALQRQAREAERLESRNIRTITANNAYRERMAARWAEADEPVYSNDVSNFYRDYRETLRRKRASGEEALDFKTENVTDGICAPGDGNRRFGVELEFDIRSGVDRYTALRNIGRELHEAGLTNTSRQVGYHSAAASGWATWSFETDCTVSGELVSPILSDTPEHWEQLRKATEIINRNGGVASTRTGSHVHVSTGSYEMNTAKHVELLRQVAKNEETIYRLSMDPARGTHRGTRWCAPNSTDQAGIVSAETRSAHNVLSGHSHHGQGMNYESTYNSNFERSNVEFRMWDGTLDPAVIQRQVMISAAMTDLAERQVIENGESRPVENRGRIGQMRRRERTALGNRRTHTAETFAESVGTAPQFIDSLFRRQEDRQRITDLFAVTNWLDS